MRLRESIPRRGASTRVAVVLDRQLRRFDRRCHEFGNAPDKDRGYEQPFRMRIGINTGFCNVGNFGSSDRMDYTIIGGEVNLAARLERQADPDGILLSYETYALVRDIVDAEDRPSIEAKGIRREIRPFALVNYIDQSGEDRFIRCNRDGVSIRIDLKKLSDENRQEVLKQLAEVMERLRR